MSFCEFCLGVVHILEHSLPRTVVTFHDQVNTTLVALLISVLPSLVVCQVEELEADIADMKKVYKEQLGLLLNQVRC